MTHLCFPLSPLTEESELILQGGNRNSRCYKGCFAHQFHTGGDAA